MNNIQKDLRFAILFLYGRSSTGTIHLLYNKMKDILKIKIISYSYNINVRKLESVSSNSVCGSTTTCTKRIIWPFYLFCRYVTEKKIVLFTMHIAE